MPKYGEMASFAPEAVNLLWSLESARRTFFHRLKATAIRFFAALIWLEIKNW